MLIFANGWLSNFLVNGYYSYHYNYLTTQLLDDLTRSALGKHPPKLKIPLSVALLLGQPFDWAIRLTGKNLPISTARIKKFCTTTHHKADKILKEGFKPKFTIEEGLHKMVNWYLTENIRRLRRLHRFKI